MGDGTVGPDVEGHRARRTGRPRAAGRLATGRLVRRAPGDAEAFAKPAVACRAPARRPAIREEGDREGGPAARRVPHASPCDGDGHRRSRDGGRPETRGGTGVRARSQSDPARGRGAIGAPSDLYGRAR